MPKPIILLTARMENGTQNAWCRPYDIHAVRESGGIPVLGCPCDTFDIPTLCHTINGILLGGGGDLDPPLFGQGRSGHEDPPCFVRDWFELALCRYAIAHRIPILGICRGMQVMAAATGGSIFTHIEGHQNGFHRVSLASQNPFASTLRNELSVNSFHHQSVKETGTFSVFATSQDGQIEGIFLPDHPFAVGVQWHPEYLFWQDIEQRSIFEALIQAASQHGARRAVT